MSNLPVCDGKIGNWGYDAASESAWTDNGTGQSITLIGAAIDTENACVYLSNAAFAYLPYAIGNDATVYFVAKAVQTIYKSSSVSWGFALCGADSNHRVFSGAEMGSSNRWVFFSSSSTYTTSYMDWGILAFTVCNGKQILYVNGTAVASFDRAIDFNFKGLYVNAGAYNGAAPTAVDGYSEDMYIKHIALFNAVHSADDVKRNTAYLQQLYFGKTSSDTIKARVAALGFMIGFNKASAQALIDIIKSYRQGIIDGDDGNGNVNELWTDDNTNDIDIPTNGDIDPENGGSSTSITEPFAGNWTSGVVSEYDDCSVKIYVTDEDWTESYVVGSGSIFIGGTTHHCYCHGKLMCDIYNSDGALRSSNVVATFFNKDFVYDGDSKTETYFKTKYITNIKLRCRYDDFNNKYINTIEYTVDEKFPKSESDTSHDYQYQIAVTSKRVSVHN